MLRQILSRSVLVAAAVAGTTFLSAPSPAFAQQAAPARPRVPQAPIGISNLIIRFQGEDEIGIAKGDYKIQLLERMRERGFAAVGAENLVFGKDDSPKAAFLLGGTVRELRCHRSLGRISCQLGVEWQLLNVAQDVVVYKALTRGVVYNVSGQRQGQLGGRLLTGSLDSLLKRDLFRQVLAAQPVASAEPDFAEASFERCAPLTKRMPEASESVLQATVLVRTASGHGSGFFLTPDGLVLTAAHVVADAPQVTLRTREGRELEAYVVRLNRPADVALLRTRRPIRGHACLSASTQPNPPVGTELYAAGAPARQELAFSMTRGILSGVRQIEGREVLQTDAPLSPGNSGGPLLNAQGAVLAIASFKLRDQAVEGVAFGIPIGRALSRLSLVPATSTEPALLSASPTDAAQESSFEPVLDSPDPVPSLVQDPGAEDASRQLREAEVQKREKEADERARKASLKERERQRDATTPGYVKAMKWGGLGLGVLGGVVGFVSYNQFDKKTSTHSDYDRLQVYNTLGWTAFFLGAGAFGTSFALRPELPPESATPPVASSRVSIGLGAVQWEGVF